MKRRILLAFFAGVLVIFPGAALAHGDEASFEKTVGGYFVDIGYNEPSPAAGDAVSFDFQLRPADAAEGTGTDVEFDDVWVKISSDTDVIFATGVHNASFGGARLSYTFVKPGTYTVSARYESTDNALAETSFPITVSAGSGSAAPAAHDNGILYGCIGFVVGLGAAFAYQRFSGK